MTPAPAGTQTWRVDRIADLLDFARDAELPESGFGWLTDDGALDAGQPRPLFLTARATYVWALEHLRTGDPEAARLAASGLGSMGRFADDTHGGWVTALDPAGAVLDDRKTAYDHVHVLLASATATHAGLLGAGETLRRAEDVITRYFWASDEQAVRESWDAAFTSAEDYRGANSNMHAVEAFLVAGDVTGNDEWHRRAAAICRRVIDVHARRDAWRIPEHFTTTWQPVPDYHRDRPDDRFRPYGTTPGHSFEWARLLLGVHDRLAHRAPSAPRPADESLDWILDAAVALFDTAVADGWAADGRPGFVYTVDARHADGRAAPVVAARLHWVVCEAILTADALHRRTGRSRFADLAREWWTHVDEHVLDHANGGWWQELDADLRPRATIWPGKPDLYHSYQALLFPSLPIAPCAAIALTAPP